MKQRIQLRRTRGWRKPPNTRSVTRPHRFGNPYRVGEHAPTAAAAVLLYRQWLEQPEQAALVEQIRTELRGCNLACWCRLDEPCHADVLLEIANG